MEIRYTIQIPGLDYDTRIFWEDWEGRDSDPYEARSKFYPWTSPCTLVIL